MTFGLNALNGRHHIRNGIWGGDWNSSNARAFMEYTISKHYPVESWEFGNACFKLNSFPSLSISSNHNASFFANQEMN